MTAADMRAAILRDLLAYGRKHGIVFHAEPTVEEVARMSPEVRQAAFLEHIERRAQSERRWNVVYGILCLGMAVAHAVYLIWRH